MVAIGPCNDCGSGREHIAKMREDFWVCEDCSYSYKKCFECEEHYNKDEMVRDRNGAYICETCKEEQYKRCEECEEWTQEDSLSEDDHHNSYCDDCKSKGHGEWDTELEQLKQDVLFERKYR